MARTFDGSNDYIQSATEDRYNASQLTWAGIVTINSTQALYSRVVEIGGHNTSDGGINIEFNPVTVLKATVWPTSNSNTTIGDTFVYATGIQYHIAITSNTVGPESIFYVDGATNGAANTITTRGTVSTEMCLAAYNFTPTSFNGAITMAEVAVWDAILTPEEILMLSKGFSPLFIRLSNLVSYLPFVRDDDNDIINNIAMTIGDSPSITAHPRVFYPENNFILTTPTGVAPPAPTRVAGLRTLSLTGAGV